MADKQYNTINIPITTNPLKPKFIQVKFKFDEPKSIEKPEYTSYLYGVEDENNQDGQIWAYSGLKNALEHLIGIDGNDDDEGNPKVAYRVTAGTIVKIMCLQTKPGDTKSNRYTVIHVAGPYKETHTANNVPTSSAPTGQPAPSSNGSSPTISKQAVAESSVYREADPERDEVFMAVARDYQRYYFEIFVSVKEELRKANPEITISEIQSAVATILIGADKKAFRYNSLYQEPEPGPHDNDVVWQALLKFATDIPNSQPPELDKGKRVAAFFNVLITHTNTDNEFSAKAVLKSLGVETIPQGAAFVPSLYHLWEQVNLYYSYRAQNFEPQAAAEAVIAHYEQLA